MTDSPADIRQDLEAARVVDAAPKRLQRRRTKGYRLPEGAASVTRPGRYGNPYKIGVDVDTSEEAVSRFRDYAEYRAKMDPTWLEPLRGRDLACFCSLETACHASVLLELANR